MKNNQTKPKVTNLHPKNKLHFSIEFVQIKCMCLRLIKKEKKTKKKIFKWKYERRKERKEDSE